MANLALSKDGSITSTASGMAMSEDDMARLRDMERKLGMSKSGQAALKKEIAKLEIELTDNPIFKKIQKLRAKVAMLKMAEKETSIQLNGAYEAATRTSRKGKSMVDAFNEMIPDVEPRAKRKGLKA